MDATEEEKSDAAWATVVANMGLALALARRRGRGRRDEDDLAQAGLVGFYMAMLDLDPSRGVSFTTYCTYRIRSYIQREAESSGLVAIPRRSRWLARRTMLGRLDRGSLSARRAETVASALAVMTPHMQGSTEAGRLILGSLEARESDGPSGEDLEELGRAMGALTSTEREVVRLRYFEGMQYEDIGRATGMSRWTASKVERGALAKMRARMAS